MENREALLAKITKMKALADKGMGGEKENAQHMLERLMLEHNITEAEISKDVIIAHEFYFERHMPFTERLLNQIVFSVIGNIDDEKGVRNYVSKSKGRVAILCTDAEYIEIVAKYEFFVYHLAEDMKLLYSAFIQTNNLFPDKSLTKPSTKSNSMTDEDLKILSLSASLDRHAYLKQLGGNNKG